MVVIVARYSLISRACKFLSLAFAGFFLSGFRIISNLTGILPFLEHSLNFVCTIKGREAFGAALIFTGKRTER